MKYVLYNPLSRNGKSREIVNELKLDSSIKVVSVLDETEYESLILNLSCEDTLTICGGDGTLNRFVNRIKGRKLPCDIYFNTTGTGNDFYNDVALNGVTGVVKINDFITNLPKVIVNDKEYLFVNGVGFGIDGYCCEKGDELLKTSTKPVNYTSIAIKGLFGDFKPCGGTVTVDGVSKRYERIWIAPTMKGRYYGGGMKVTPEQDRLNKEGIVSTAVFHSSGKLKTLIIFPKLFKGTHVSHKDVFDIFTGKHVVVEFDKAMALQIDGETIKNVKKYEVVVD